MTPLALTRRLQIAALSVALCAAWPAQADANLSEASLAVSLAPVALSVGVVGATGVALSAVPVGLLSAGTALVVVSVQVVGGATVWVLERVSDGVRLSVRTAGRLAEGSAVAAGAAITVSVIGAGTLLSASQCARAALASTRKAAPPPSTLKVVGVQVSKPSTRSVGGAKVYVDWPAQGGLHTVMIEDASEALMRQPAHLSLTLAPGRSHGWYVLGWSVPGADAKGQP